MHRVMIYAAAVIAIAIPAVLLGSTLFASEEDQLKQIVGSLEEERFTLLLDAAAFDTGGLVVSTGRNTQRFSGAEREAARALLEQATGLEAAQQVRLRQRQVTIRGTRATAIVNMELDDGEWVALRMELSRSQDRWLVESIRVMG